MLLQDGGGGNDGVLEFGDALDAGEEEGYVEVEQDELEELRRSENFVPRFDSGW